MTIGYCGRLQPMFYWYLIAVSYSSLFFSRLLHSSAWFHYPGSQGRRSDDRFLSFSRSIARRRSMWVSQNRRPRVHDTGRSGKSRWQTRQSLGPVGSLGQMCSAYGQDGSASQSLERWEAWDHSATSPSGAAISAHWLGLPVRDCGHRHSAIDESELATEAGRKLVWYPSHATTDLGHRH